MSCSAQQHGIMTLLDGCLLLCHVAVLDVIPWRASSYSGSRVTVRLFGGATGKRQGVDVFTMPWLLGRYSEHICAPSKVCRLSAQIHFEAIRRAYDQRRSLCSPLGTSGAPINHMAKSKA